MRGSTRGPRGVGGSLLLGVVLQRVVVVVDADAQQQSAQTLHQPLVLAQVLRDLARQLRGASGLRDATWEKKRTRATVLPNGNFWWR